MANYTIHEHPATPPATAVPELVHGGHARNISGSSAGSYDYDSPSPTSVHTQISTPSPILGHQLLPKIRTQDQDTPTPSHRRAVSQSRELGDTAAYASSRSCTVPPHFDSVTPTSATSTLFSPFSAGAYSANNSPVSLVPPQDHRRALGHNRSHSASGHNRSHSATGLDEATLRRYAFPYRNAPTYASGPPQGWMHTVYPAPPAQTRPKPRAPQALPAELRFRNPHGLQEPTQTALAYLRAPNPAIDLVRETNRTLGGATGAFRHCWWDVRNVRRWGDFNLDTILSVPGFPQLLNMELPATAFPSPQIAPSRLRPDSADALFALVRDFHAAKVTAACKVAQGPHHLSLRPGPERHTLVANYADDRERAPNGQLKARLVGLVRPYQRWNTGKRAEPGHDKLLYLEGLACLQRLMRENECRYGFLASETELVCARLGAEPGVPHFGLLELASPVETRHRDGLTAGLALWYLHMLAKEEPLPGQCGWRVTVGEPKALSRQHVLDPKDAWIPEPNKGERRNALIVRGWVFPKDKLHKRETGKTGRK